MSLHPQHAGFRTDIGPFRTRRVPPITRATGQEEKRIGVCLTDEGVHV